MWETSGSESKMGWTTRNTSRRLLRVEGRSSNPKMEESYSDRRRRDEEVKQRISEKLAQSGEREKLKELLRHKLIECGWRDEMKAHCKEVIRSKGIDQVTVDDLIEEITPKARATVPENIKGEMLDKIKAFIEKAA